MIYETPARVYESSRVYIIPEHLIPESILPRTTFLAWTSNYIHIKPCDRFILPCPKLSGSAALVDVKAWMDNCIPNIAVELGYLSMSSSPIHGVSNLLALCMGDEDSKSKIC